MLKSARDRVESLMHVVEKVQVQQAAMSSQLHAEKRKIAQVSSLVLSRASFNRSFM